MNSYGPHNNHAQPASPIGRLLVVLAIVGTLTVLMCGGIVGVGYFIYQQSTATVERTSTNGLYKLDVPAHYVQIDELNPFATFEVAVHSVKPGLPVVYPFW